jgi:biopolymer transport protein ExbB
VNIDKAFSVLASSGSTWIFWVLIGLSLIAFAVAADRIIHLLASHDDIDLLKEDVLDSLARGNREEAMVRLRRSPSVEAKVALAGLACERAASAEQRMSSVAQFSKLTMERYLSVLATIGANAPFVGLLGTVIGIIRAFRALDASAGRMSAHLMSEIGEALVATAVGLLVALPPSRSTTPSSARCPRDCRVRTRFRVKFSRSWSGRGSDMASISGSSDGPVSTINITPLVDVVLVLLVALMVAATEISARSMSVELPRAATGEDAHPRTLPITLDASGGLFLDGKPITEDALVAAARDAHAVDKDVHATLAADGRVPHARVVRVMDLLRREDVVHFALQVAPEG